MYGNGNDGKIEMVKDRRDREERQRRDTEKRDREERQRKDTEKRDGEGRLRDRETETHRKEVKGPSIASGLNVQSLGVARDPFPNQNKTEETKEQKGKFFERLPRKSLPNPVKKVSKIPSQSMVLSELPSSATKGKRKGNSGRPLD